MRGFFDSSKGSGASDAVTTFPASIVDDAKRRVSAQLESMNRLFALKNGQNKPCQEGIKRIQAFIQQCVNPAITNKQATAPQHDSDMDIATSHSPRTP